MVEVESGLTVLQACESVGIEIPRFCYHERLSIAGNCRMCLVEMENSPKPVASCAMPISEGMSVKTNTDFVKKARNGVMEFLLINHPLDCPICDQGGECDLQDQALAYGKGFSRFVESKRAVKDKDLGPLIKTHMTRCIHCTRCVRFAEEIAGVDQLGTVGRGEDTEITSYLEHAIDSELSGNVIDLCPVGALTSKPYAFIARPWELKKTDSIDLMDAFGSNIRFDTKGEKIMRVLPRVNEFINEEWISDKTRFAYDGLSSQRLNNGYALKNNKLVEVTNSELVEIVTEKLKKCDSNKVGALLGNTVDCETIFSFKLFLESIGCNNFDCRQDGSFFVSGDRSSYLFNSSISGIEHSDLCLLIGSNPRVEAPILNSKLRKKLLDSSIDYNIARIGEAADLTYKVNELGSSAGTLKSLIDGKHPFCRKLKKSKKPLFILGQGALCRDDSEEIYHTAKNLYKKYFNEKSWNGFNVLQTFSGRTGALDLNFCTSKKLTKNSVLNSAKKGELDILYLFAADDINLDQIDPSTFVIYHGHHGDKSAQIANLIIPSPCFTESEGIYVNIEGRPQVSSKVRNPLPNVNEAWKFFLAVLENLNVKVNFRSFEELRELMFQQHPHLQKINKLSKTNLSKFKNVQGNFFDLPLKSNIKNFYMTDSVSRLSKVMAECSKRNITNVV